MEDNKVISMNDLITKIETKNDFHPDDKIMTRVICIFLKEMYKELEVVDEIILEEFSDELHSIKRTPTINEQQEKLDNSKVMFSGKEIQNNFKIYFTRKVKND